VRLSRSLLPRLWLMFWNLRRTVRDWRPLALCGRAFTVRRTRSVLLCRSRVLFARRILVFALLALRRSSLGLFRFRRLALLRLHPRRQGEHQTDYGAFGDLTAYLHEFGSLEDKRPAI
jgi:hypothetical protein